MSTHPTLSETMQISERLAPEQAKGEVEIERTLDGSSEIEIVGAQPHREGETRLLEPVKHDNHPILAKDPSIPIFAQAISARIPTHAGSDQSVEVSESVVNTVDDDVLHTWSLLPKVLSLPPPITGSGDDAAPSLEYKVHAYTYYDQIWVYSALEAFKNGISKEDFVVISNLQRLDKINDLEKLEPIRLSLRNQVLTSEDENSKDSDNPPAPKGDIVIRQFLLHHVSSKARTTQLVKYINHLGAHIIDLDVDVDHVAVTVKDQTTATSASIFSLLESQNALSQRLTALEANQASIMKNQSVIMNTSM